MMTEFFNVIVIIVMISIVMEINANAVSFQIGRHCTFDVCANVAEDLKASQTHISTNDERLSLPASR